MTLTVNGDTYFWDLGTLPPDTHGSITILATLDPMLTTEFTFLNTATLTGTLGLAAPGWKSIFILLWTRDLIKRSR